MLIYQSYEIFIQHAPLHFAIGEVGRHLSRAPECVCTDRREAKMATKETDGQVLSVDWDHLIKKRKINIEKSTRVFEKHGRNTENV